MNEQDLVSRIRATDSAKESRALAQQLVSESLAGPKAVVDAWATGDKAEAPKADYVVAELGELALRPMLGHFDSGTANWRYRLASEAVSLLADLRRKTLRALDGLLTDEAEVAAPAQPAKAGAGPLRVCDESYVWIRRLAQIDDLDKAGLHSERDFLQLDQRGRRQEIQQWRRSRTRRRLVETEDQPEFG